MVFGDPWAALGAFGRPLGLHLSPSGLHWGASGASLGSICRLWGSIGAPVGRHSGPSGAHLGASGVPLVLIFCLWGNFGQNMENHCFHIALKSAMKRPKCEKTRIFVVQIDDSKKQIFHKQKATSSLYAYLLV